MTARVSEAAWSAFCAVCAEGSGPHEDYDEADAWRTQHNAEQHTKEGSR